MGSRLIALGLCASLLMTGQSAVAENHEPAENGSKDPVTADVADPAAKDAASPDVADDAVSVADDADAAAAPPDGDAAQDGSEDPGGGAAAAGDAGAGEAPDAIAPLKPILPIGDELADANSAKAPVDPEATKGPTCRDDTIWLRGDFGEARFTVDVAADAASRAQGLMQVPSMPSSKGMLFVYGYPRPVSFWMKNTLIPLDIIFADEHGVVLNVHDMAKPGDETTIPGDGLVQYVLEINGGIASPLGIDAGTQLRHPAIANSAWPCPVKP